MANGIIKRLFKDKGFGFIARGEGGKDVFFHLSSLHGTRFDDLDEGMSVQMEYRQGNRGLEATSVTVQPGARIRPTARDTAGDRPETTPTGPAEQASRQADYRFYNPYNFVRFLEPEGTRSDNQVDPVFSGSMAEGLAPLRKRSPKPSDDQTTLRLLGRCSPPPHDRYVGLTGRIHCTLVAVTPLFVSDSEAIEKTGKHRTYRFFQQDGKYAIPASSLRGMIRSVFEAATNSCMIHLAQNVRLSRHVATDEAQRLVPARIVEDSGTESGFALEVFPGDTDFKPGQKPRGPQFAAWVPRYLGKTLRGGGNRHAGGGARGQRCGTYRDYGERANLDDAVMDRFRDRECCALLGLYQHPRRNYEFYSVIALAETKQELAVEHRGDIVAKGWLYVTNQNIENKHDERFFFRSERLGAPGAADRFALDGEILKRYRELIDDYQQRQADELKQRKKPSQPDRSDRDARKHKPGLSRHIINLKARDLKPGDLVYAHINHDREVLFVAPVALPRVSYEHMIHECLPHALNSNDKTFHLPGNLVPCDNRDLLCPTCRTFGWVTTDTNENEAEKREVGFGGRLRFGQGRLIEDAGVMGPILLAILSSPKPTSTLFYLANPNDGGYDDTANELRGRKFYRHHPKAVEQEYSRAGSRADDQNRTVKGVLKPGARFDFSIDFENLAPLELGALLWSLDLNGKGFHRLGFAKPLGFGSVRIEIGGLETMSAEKRYGSVEPHAGWIDAMVRKTEWIDTFRTAMVDTYRSEGAKGFDGLPNIADLLTLLTAPIKDLPIHYPRPGPKPDPDGKNFEWFVGNKRVHERLPLPADDEGLLLLDRNSGRQRR